MEVLNFFLRRSDEFLFQALVFYQFPCLDASFYYSILSPLKSVVSGKFFKRIKFLSLTGINFNVFHGFAGCESMDAKWSFRKALGVLRWRLEA
ncbi:hypothetical protein RHGRI_001205 [Rhododendron griersonianum]|uniref:Maturase K n=1 Tax=Rhododendron griersonianum TaxID=479676 RepID=A0AAV6KPV9_9ERIC|nr:hypothetical protein RHGRI_037438 [Rhododendron griersonianum]KAG5521639.1 hypothetical protein RHGRI_034012 [Rhododendron griersonianum]KAG5531882.1 hypothetical protein RHGRI_026480 [Rhododendron griersonianum]KAG5550337.1 hypothetical protein RHGRI_015335 [Rhododendron griersonianum]KAG5552239.1 hypothetical protein RHGRI_010354 [Rhododendron griersonianum]